MSSPRLVFFWRWAVRVVALGYPIALLAVVAGFRLVGERWWVTTVALYLPRAAFALPLPFLTLALAFDPSRRWLGTQLVALGVLLFPVLGLHLSTSQAATPGAFRFRVLTFNVDSVQRGIDDVLAQVRAENPDLILIQEAGYGDADSFRSRLSGYSVDKTGQFVIASRFPIEERFEPPLIPLNGALRTPRSMRYRLATPGGPLQVYNVHPISPRESLGDLRGAGLGHELASGRIFRPETGPLMITAALRAAQIEKVVEDAGRASAPVLIAGDTNLPEQSWALRRSLGGFRDAFADAGFGFGYTFPATRRPWMRIDRILAGTGLRFLDCSVIKQRVSDHLAVVADVELAPVRAAP